MLRFIASNEGRKYFGRILVRSFDKSQSLNNEERSTLENEVRTRQRSVSLSSVQDIHEGFFVRSISSNEGEAVHSVASVCNNKLAAFEDVQGRARPPTSPSTPTTPTTTTSTSFTVTPTSHVDLDLTSITSSYTTPRSSTVKNIIASTRRPPSSAASNNSKRLQIPTCDAQTITEVCSGGEIPEVEIISLLEEQIPRYKLRADTLTQFTGYDNQDWYIPSPLIKVEEVDLKLSPEQIRETLNYFILCSNRVSQMTKTYNDIEAVTRLLEEKERDLELTARIGKELLQTNTKLENNVVSLEGELRAAQEKITQLSHELVKKTELIQVLTNDVDESGSEGATPTELRSIDLALMQKRISCLEDENISLRTEYQRLAIDTTDVEEQEARLVKDIAMQLANANMDVDTMVDELEQLKEENRLQHEQIINLTTKLNEAEMKLHKFTVENDEMSSLLHITKETQTSLATELAECKERYTEVLGLLRDTQEQLRRQRRRTMPTARGGALYPWISSVGQPDSLQSELESSLYSQSSYDSGIGGSGGLDRMPPYKKVFETVRCSSRASNSSYEGSTLGGPTGIGGAALFPKGPLNLTQTHITASSHQPRMSSFPQVSRYSSMSIGSSLGYPSLDSTGQSDNESMNTDSTDGYPGASQPGIPGIPGAADLEAALRRLTPAEVTARRATLSSGQPYGGYDYDSGVQSPPSLPFGYRTPDSIMSTGSSALSNPNNNSSWKLPEKLQIVKPLEGSQTLHHWSKLATPTLSGLLDDRSGVKIRGERALEDIGLETYTLSDLEEDEEYSNPGKKFDSSSCVYTYTMSTVLHPDEVASVTDSVRGSRVASVCPSVHGSPPPTPRVLSRRNSTTTFSTTLGLAKMLNERGIKAVTPSCLNTPSGLNSFTPTATPCNSPDGTSPPSRSESPPPLGLGFLSTGAELLRRTFGVEQRPTRRSKRSSKLALSRTEKKALSDIRIVEKIEKIGLDNIMATTALSVSPLVGSLYTSCSRTTPMIQLTTLKSSLSSCSSESSESNSDVLKSKPPLRKINPNTESDKKLTRTPERDRISLSRERTPASALGIPGKPGCGQLNRRLEQLAARQNRRQAGGLQRSDLGTVAPPNGPKTNMGTQHQPMSTSGTISSLLFGRKGGLL